MATKKSKSRKPSKNSVEALMAKARGNAAMPNFEEELSIFDNIVGLGDEEPSDPDAELEIREDSPLEEVLVDPKAEAEMKGSTEAPESLEDDVPVSEDNAVPDEAFAEDEALDRHESPGASPVSVGEDLDSATGEKNQTGAPQGAPEGQPGATEVETGAQQGATEVETEVETGAQPGATGRNNSDRAQQGATRNATGLNRTQQGATGRNRTQPDATERNGAQPSVTGLNRTQPDPTELNRAQQGATEFNRTQQGASTGATSAGKQVDSFRLVTAAHYRVACLLSEKDFHETSVRRICVETDVPYNTVRKTLDKFEKAGLFERERWKSGLPGQGLDIQMKRMIPIPGRLHQRFGPFEKNSWDEYYYRTYGSGQRGATDGVTGRSRAQPGATGRDVAEHGATWRNMAQPGVTGLNGAQPGARGHNGAQPGATDINEAQPGASEVETGLNGAQPPSIIHTNKLASSSSKLERKMIDDPEYKFWRETKPSLAYSKCQSWIAKFSWLTEDSLDLTLRHFAWDVTTGKRKAENPVALLHKILQDDGAYPVPEDYKSFEEQEAEKVLAEIRRRQKTQDALRKAEEEALSLEAEESARAAFEKGQGDEEFEQALASLPERFRKMFASGANAALFKKAMLDALKKYYMGEDF